MSEADEATAASDLMADVGDGAADDSGMIAEEASSCFAEAADAAGAEATDFTADAGRKEAMTEKAACDDTAITDDGAMGTGVAIDDAAADIFTDAFIC
jgi:hypothetical protein